MAAGKWLITNALLAVGGASAALAQAPVVVPVAPASKAPPITPPIHNDRTTSPTGDSIGTPSSEIVVTALRRSTTVGDAAASTSVVTAQDIEDRGGISDPADLIDMLPGVNFVDSGGINSEVNIRGAGASSQQTNDTDSAVAILRNGSQLTGGNIGGKMFGRMDTFDLGQAEVVRGPQGALYGANAVGGVVNLVTQRPKFSVGASAQIGYTPEIDRSEAQFIVNIPLSRTLAIRTGGVFQKRNGGYFYNAALQEYGDQANSKTGRFSLLWKPSSAISNLTTIDGSDETDTPSTIRTQRISADTGIATDIDGPYEYGHNTRDLNHSREYAVQNNFEWTTGFGKVVSITSWRSTNRDSQIDNDGTAPGYIGLPTIPVTCTSLLCTRTFFDNTDAFRQELRVEAKVAKWLDILVGANYQNINTIYDIVLDGYNVFRSTDLSGTRNVGQVSNRSEKQYGVFGSAEIKLSRNLVLTGAARYNRSDKTSERYNVPLSPSAGLVCPYQDPQSIDPLADPCAQKVQLLSQRFIRVQPSAAIRYALNPRWAVFASVAQGYRPGGFNPNAIDNPDLIPATYEGESTLSYEVGTKYKLKNMLFTLTGFTNKYSNLLVTGTLDDDPNDDVTSLLRYRFNAGSARNWGFDAEANGRIKLSRTMGDIALQTAINYVRGRVNDGPFVGQIIEGTPTWTTTGSATWTKPVGEDWRMILGASYRGERGGFSKTNTFANQVLRPDIDSVRARFALENNGIRFEVRGDNLLDTAQAIQRTATSEIYTDRRSISVRVGYATGSESRNRPRIGARGRTGSDDVKRRGRIG